ncbi:hypothetical protein PoB_007105800 [Plakobranchus ocellatus]|uniref:Uncharacterized protein n=1 Tax=Plakobranchus ocellatus TaxID=259542 RepID=A0AAV4DJU8_9GAST|nr:hypothetical protein PoB_007105800 [Plakobranchus ocellatus]
MVKQNMEVGRSDHSYLWLLYTAFPQQGDLRLSGPPSGQGASGGARTPDRMVLADLRVGSLSTVPPTLPSVSYLHNIFKAGWFPLSLQKSLLRLPSVYLGGPVDSKCSTIDLSILQTRLRERK